MGFLNAMLLFGTAAFAVPLGIHLLNRSRFHTVPWAAMHLLDVSDLQNTRRIEWQSLLLLLVRCLIPVTLAVCMARPLLQTAVVGAAGGRSTTVLLVDDSFSMQGLATGAGDRASGWQAAQDAAARIVDVLAPQAELAVVAMGGEARQVGEPSRGDPRPALGAIGRLEPIEASLDVSGGGRSAGEILADSRQPHRQVVVLSDFQRGDWAGGAEAALQTLRQQGLAADLEPELHLIPVSVEPQANVSVTFDAATDEVTLLGEPVDLQLTVVNHAAQPVSDLPLRLAIDGRGLVSRRIDLPASGRSQVLFTIDIEAPGDHLASVEIDDPAAAITADDRDVLTLQTLPARRVLMIEQEARPTLLENDTGFLQLALESTASDDGQGQAARVRRVSIGEIREPLIAESDVIVLGNVPRLPDEVVGWVAARVADGGLLCVLPGDTLDLAWYEQTLGPTSPSPLLPWRYGQLQAASPETIRGGPYADPLLAFFDDPQHGRLEAVTVTSCRELDAWKPSPDDASSAVGEPSSAVGDDAARQRGPAEVLLATEAGTPLLVRGAFGSGRVLQWAITATETSGSLPREPVFVPLVQRLLLLDLSAAAPRDAGLRQRESSIDPWPEVELVSLAQRIGATLHPSAESFLAHDRNRQGGREVWRWLLAAVLVLLFAEMLMAGRLTRRGGR